MRYKITHRTNYGYTVAVPTGYTKAYITPLDLPLQTRISTRVEIDPKPEVFDQQTDIFGNTVTFFAIQRPHTGLVVTGLTEIETHARETPDPKTTMPWEEAREYLAAHESEAALEAYQFTFESPYIRVSDPVVEYAQASFPAGRPVLEAALDLTRRIHADFRYVPQSTDIMTPLEELLRTRSGVCQDFSHLEIACLRAMGLAARYVSGYLRTIPPPGKEPLTGADATHAWISVFVPNAGWVDLDPTNNMLCCEDHVLIAVGRDFDDVSPLRGVVAGGGLQSLDVSVEVTVVK
jgi:transglutaminase-like putative cysteine protease